MDTCEQSRTIRHLQLSAEEEEKNNHNSITKAIHIHCNGEMNVPAEAHSFSAAHASEPFPLK